MSILTYHGRGSKRKAGLFQCMECGHKYPTVGSAECGAMRGCPTCGGVDVDIYVGTQHACETYRKWVSAGMGWAAGGVV